MTNGFSEPRRMSAGALAIIFLKTLREFWGVISFAFIYVIFSTGEGRSFPAIMLKILLLTAGVVAFSLIVAFFRYYFRKYHIEGDRLIFSHGFAARQTTFIPLAKVHNLRTKRGLFYRLLGMHGVTFDTLANELQEVELILDESDWQMLLDCVSEGEKVAQTKGATVAPPIPEGERRWKIDNTAVVKGALCQNHLRGFAVLVAVLAPVFDSLNDLGGDTASRVFDYIDSGTASWLTSAWQWTGFFIVVYLCITLLWVGKIVLRFADMTITLSGRLFTMESGLLSRFTCRLARSKATIVTIKQNPLERLARCETVTLGQAENASGEKGRDKVRIYGSRLGADILAWWLGDGCSATDSAPLLSAQSGRGVFMRHFLSGLLVSAAAVFALIYFAEMQVAAACALGGACAAFAALRAFMVWRHSRIALFRFYIKIECGNIARICHYIKPRDIEGVEIRLSPFSPITRRASLRLSTNAETVVVRSLMTDTAFRLRRLILSHRPSARS